MIYDLVQNKGQCLGTDRSSATGISGPVHVPIAIHLYSLSSAVQAGVSVWNPLRTTGRDWTGQEQYLRAEEPSIITRRCWIFLIETPFLHAFLLSDL